MTLGLAGQQGSDPVARAAAGSPTNAASVLQQSSGSNRLLLAAATSEIQRASSSQFRSFNAALGNLLAGVSNAVLVLLGDSTSFGTGASTRTKDYAHQMTALFNARGIPAECDSIWGMEVFASLAALIAYDSRVTSANTTGWTAGNAVSLAGQMFQNSSSAAGEINFTPEKNIDTFDFWYPTDPQFGTFSVQIDGGTALNVVQSSNGGVWTYSGTTWTQTTAPTSRANAFGKANHGCMG